MYRWKGRRDLLINFISNSCYHKSYALDTLSKMWEYQVVPYVFPHSVHLHLSLSLLLHSHTEHCVHVFVTLSAGSCVALLLVHDVCMYITCLFHFLYCYDRAQDGQLSSSLLREEMLLPPNLSWKQDLTYSGPLRQELPCMESQRDPIRVRLYVVLVLMCSVYVVVCGVFLHCVGSAGVCGDLCSNAIKPL